MFTGIRRLLPICPFISSFFFLSNFQTLKCFVTLFSGTVRPRIFKLCSLMDSGQVYRVYRNQAAAAYSSLFFIFLSLQFSKIKIFVTLFSGTVRPRRLKLGTHVDSGQMYSVYRNQAAAAAAYSSLYFFVFLSNFQTLKYFLILFSGTVKPGRLILGTHVDSGQMYCVYRNQAAAAYSSLYFFIFLSLQFSNITIFMYLIHPFISSFFFLSNFQTLQFLCIVYTGIRLLLLIRSFISSVFFLSNFQTLKIFVALFSGTVRPIKLKLNTHVDIGWMYRVYRNQAATSYLSLISLFFFLSNVQK